ncbi:glutamate synthase subunit beta [Rarobacter incanus]|uniref:Glutamate synthase (NADPH/NADH) small chain n=1 Tax=Rarobacter incanus TaxID=153494 RepID=A0A542SMU5_9MICO|nr:glutamate synthase subunit beta [Rarobacter incanus]TQK75951.1 glutamate synthase (NADPH/NADH) small chain [Rarobacter incanus]
MADPRGFLRTRNRELPLDRPVPLRIRDFAEVHPSKPEGAAGLDMTRRQASRCMDCGVPFCHFSCPLGNLVPEWNDLVRTGHWEDAVERLHATNNLPEVTGRLCPALCESGCVLSINDPAVTIRNIEVAIAEEGFSRGLITPMVINRHTGNRVAVVGSGPAGLAAAQQLTRAGHQVTVYERSDAPGGLLRYGIPEFKMASSVIDRRIDQMIAEGTAFRCGIDVGKDTTIAQLREQYEAVVIAIGSPTPRDLPVPGRELGGVIQAMDYLVPATRKALGKDVTEHYDANGLDVIVVGGGDTGSDCIGTAVRQGARSITQLEIMPQPPAGRPANQPWPIHPAIFKVSSSHEEGGERLFQVSTSRLLGDESGSVTHIELEQVEFDAGRFVPISSAPIRLPAQLVVLAMGFVGVDRAEMGRDWGLGVDERGRVERADDYSTQVDGVFVAGDAGRGQSLIVWAIAEGRSAAAEVDKYLMGRTELPHAIGATEQPLRA